MSAKIISNLMKRRWTMEPMAHSIAVSTDFIERVRAKKNVLTWADLKKLASLTKQSAQLILLNSIHIRPGMEPLFESTRRVLELSATPIPRQRQVNDHGKRRRSTTKAA
jgi:hypothetical protein